VTTDHIAVYWIVSTLVFGNCCICVAQYDDVVTALLSVGGGRTDGHLFPAGHVTEDNGVIVAALPDVRGRCGLE